MRVKRAVWILDGLFYIQYLEECFQKILDTHPWLIQPYDSPSRQGNWNWRAEINTDRSSVLPTRRDGLINWIIREELEKRYYLGVQNHISIQEFEEIHHRLVNEFDLELHTWRFLPVPRIRNYVETQFAERVNGTLVLELQFFD